MTDMPTLDPGALRSARDKYRPHLDFRSKAAIYALYHHSGVSTHALARTFGVHKLTVHHLIDASPKHYADVKAKVNELGLEAFYQTYVRPDDFERINKTWSAEPRRRGPRVKPEAKPNPVAAGYAGKQTIDGIEVSIDWLGVDNGRRRPEHRPGWYWRLLDEADYHGTETDGRPGASSNDVRAWLQQNSEWLVSYYRSRKDDVA